MHKLYTTRHKTQQEKFMQSSLPSPHVIILAAGKGTRMRSDLPKVLHPVAGRSMLGHVLDVAGTLDASIQVVVGEHMQEYRQTITDLQPEATQIVQREQLGTGHAVQVAYANYAANYAGEAEQVIVLYGDTPLITPATLKALQGALAVHDLVVLGMRPHDPAQYGRLVCDNNNTLQAIVEYADATPQERAISLCNSGVMAMRCTILREQLPNLRNDNAKGEYYLTDLVALARAAGKSCGVVEAAESELRGVNNRAELAAVEAIWQQRTRQHWLLEGVSMQAPETVFFHYDTKLAPDVSLEPHIWFGKGVQVAGGVHIRAYSHIEGAVIGTNASIGPYARLRPGAILAEDVHLGNFVEVKNSTLHAGVKAGHLSYIGDAEIGEQTNIGAGTITCNYDGKHKHKTIIGRDAFIGSNTALVAPVVVGDGALIAAGSTITKDVPKDALAFARARQMVREKYSVF